MPAVSSDREPAVRACTPLSTAVRCLGLPTFCPHNDQGLISKIGDQASDLR